jgi:phosphopantothenoylcysteine decarboxylase/phosphopantothenate--cysteine ligase
MYDNPIVQENIELLKKHGFIIMEPEYGQLACGYEGKGRLPEPQKIVDEIEKIINKKQDLLGVTVLVTAGPTYEPIDPVRFITNRSSGKMGYAIADAALNRGARVILITGPTSLTPPAKAEVIKIETAIQMRDSVLAHFDEADIVIMAAAVSDYKPINASQQKIKKDQGPFTLNLELNPDILAELGRLKRKNQIIVGFSMETENLIENSKKKLSQKNADLIVANDISKEGAGFGSDTNIVTIIGPFGIIKELPKMSKYDVANVILDTVISLKNASTRN